MVILVLLPEPLQDLDGLVHRGRLDHDRLEAAFQRAVLLDVLPVLVEGRRPHALQLAARQRGLEHVGRVDGAFRGARAHQRVQLVDEQDDLLVLGDLVHDRLEPLLELPAVLGARDDRRHVEREHSVVAKHVGAEPVSDQQREALHDRRLPDARLADEHRVVLLPAREDLHHPLDLLGPPDGRVELPFGAELGQIAAEVVERGGLGFLLGLGRGAGRRRPGGPARRGLRHVAARGAGASRPGIVPG